MAKRQNNKPITRAVDQNVILTQALRIGYFFVLLLILFLLFPFQEIVYLLRFRTLNVDLDSFIFSITQKVVFLLFAAFFAVQLYRLLVELVQRRSYLYERPFKNAARRVSRDYLSPGDAPTISSEDARGRLNPERLFKAFISRMKLQSARTEIISNRNLLIGMGFSLSALFFIAYPLVFSAVSQEISSADPSAATVNWLVKYYLPRLAIGILLQFVGFFFLRLYVANEQDIRHNSNEITNFEAKMLGLLTAEKDKTLLSPLIESLAKTERNFVLKKGERSIILDGDLRYNDVESLASSLRKLLPTKFNQKAS